MRKKKQSEIKIIMSRRDINYRCSLRNKKIEAFYFGDKWKIFKKIFF